MLAALKGLPFAYNRDLIEDKNAAFEAVDTLALVLPAMTGMVQTMHEDVDVLARQASEGFTGATEVVDWLARKGMPVSEAHEITGALVRRGRRRESGSPTPPTPISPRSISTSTAGCADASRQGPRGRGPQRGHGGAASDPRARADGAAARHRRRAAPLGRRL